jgi:hypothetical protein
MKTIILILLFLLTTCMANMPNNCKKLWDIKENKQTVMIYMCIDQPENIESLLTPTIITNTSNNNNTIANIANNTNVTNIANNTNVTNITNVNDIIRSFTTTTLGSATLATTTTQEPTTTLGSATLATTTAIATTTHATTAIATTTQGTTTLGSATHAATTTPAVTTTQKPVPVIAATRAPTTQKPVPVIATTQKPVSVPVIDPVVSTTTKLRGQGNINSNLNNNIVQNKEPPKEGLSQTTQTLIIVFSGITIVSIIGSVTYSCTNKKEPITPNQSNQRMLDNRYSPGRGTNPNIQQQTSTIHPRRLQHMNSWYNSNNDIRKLSTQMKKKRKNKKTNDNVEHGKTHPGENGKNDKTIPRAPSSQPPPLPKPTLHDREQDLRQFLKTDISLQNPRTELNKKDNSIPTDDKSSKNKQ